MSIRELDRLQTNRIVSKGTLAALNFEEGRLFSFDRFVLILKTLDPDSRKVLFPDPHWFLLRNYHITRVGFTEASVSADSTMQITIGIEYQTDFYPHVLSFKVPLEMANNILSQIEKGQDVGRNGLDASKKISGDSID